MVVIQKQVIERYRKNAVPGLPAFKEAKTKRRTEEK